jgi:hypothetical protein
LLVMKAKEGQEKVHIHNIKLLLLCFSTGEWIDEE